MTLQKTLIIGLGLIGGSFAKALKTQEISNKIIACDLDEESLELAKSDNIIDGFFTDLTHLMDEIDSFDLIVVATPLSSYKEILAKISNVKSLVIDLGSVKNFQFKKLPQNFIPCHPIAGLENSGFEYSSADLFKNKKFIICKENAQVTELAEKIGALPENMGSKKHDEIYALVSHLPQFLSFLTGEFSPKEITDELFAKAFRLDNSDPEIWDDVFKMNEENLENFYLEFFDNLEENLSKNAEELFEILTSLKPETTDLADSSAVFFDENSAAVLFRLIIAVSYLQIVKIKKFLPYAGSGFADFTSIIFVTNFDKEKTINLIAANKKQLDIFLQSIS